jgi:hypothetical protein
VAGHLPGVGAGGDGQDGAGRVEDVSDGPLYVDAAHELSLVASQMAICQMLVRHRLLGPPRHRLPRTHRRGPRRLPPGASSNRLQNNLI